MSDNKKAPASTPSLVEASAGVFLTEKRLAERHQRAPRTLRNDRNKGGYLPFHKFGRQVRYPLSDIFEHERAHRMDSTSSNKAENGHSPLDDQ